MVALGLGPRSNVAICEEKSMNAIIAPTTVHVTVALPNEEFDLEIQNVTSLDELEERLTMEYPAVQSFVFVWSV